MTRDDNDAAPSRTRRRWERCFAFLLEKSMHSSTGCFGVHGQSHIDVPSQPTACIVDNACIVQRTPRGQAAGQRSILSLVGCATPRTVSAEKTIRHWCCVLPNGQVPDMTITATPTSPGHHEHLTSSYSRAHTITKLRNQHVYRRGQESSAQVGFLRGLAGYQV